MEQLPLETGDDDNVEEQSSSPVIEIAYPWTANFDEWRRAFIFEHMADKDWDGKCLVEAMRAVESWMRGNDAELVVLSDYPTRP